MSVGERRHKSSGLLVMSTCCDHLTLDQLKLHAFGRINSSDLTSKSTPQRSDDDREMTHDDKHQSRRSTEHDMTLVDCDDREMTHDDKHQSRRSTEHDMTLVGCDDVPAASIHTSDDCLLSHSGKCHESNDNICSSTRVQRTDVSVSVCQSSSDCHRATELLCATTDDHRGSCQSHEAAHSHTDLPQSTTTRLMSLPLTTSRWFTDVERQRQRQNVELIRELTAQADIISEHVAWRVDTDYLALPLTNTNRDRRRANTSSSQITARTSDITSNSSSLSLYQPNISSKYCRTTPRRSHFIREVDRSAGVGHKRLLSESCSCQLTTEQRDSSAADRLAVMAASDMQRHQSSHGPADVCGRPASIPSSQMTFNSRHNTTLAAAVKMTDVKKNKVTFSDDVELRDALWT